jgi:hypothetical protein
LYEESGVIHNITSDYKLIHSSSLDNGFNYTETINEYGEMEYFNIIVVNLNDTSIYFNLTVNDVLVSQNVTLLNGTNVTVNALENVSFTLPGDQTINITMMNASGDLLDVNYLTYLDYTLLDEGFNYTQNIPYSGELNGFNFTILNTNGTTIYMNLTINDNLIVYNQSLTNGSNFVIDASSLTNFTIPGNQTINVTITDVFGNVSIAKYMSWIDYIVQEGNYTFYIGMMNSSGSRYYTTYNSTILGTHQVRICANDTRSLVNCTESIDVIAAGTTVLKVDPDKTIVDINNINRLRTIN